MSSSNEKDRNRGCDPAKQDEPGTSQGRYVGTATASSSSSEPKHKQESTSSTPTIATAQAEFLDDIRISLEELKEGKVLPAEQALKLIEQGLDDDELECYLPQPIYKKSQ